MLACKVAVVFKGFHIVRRCKMGRVKTVYGCLRCLCLMIINSLLVYQSSATNRTYTDANGMTWSYDDSDYNIKGVTPTASGCLILPAVLRFASTKSLTGTNGFDNVTHIVFPTNSFFKEVYVGREDYFVPLPQNLSGIVIPDNVKKVGPWWEFGTLKLVVLPNGLPLVVKYLSGRSFQDSSCRIVRYGEDKTVVVPAVDIPEYMFYQCDWLNGITLSSGTTAIGKEAFYNCTGLSESFPIPSTVSNIGEGAFDGCTNITTVTIPASVSKLQARVFKGCTSLQSATLQSGLKDIDENAFVGCINLRSIAIPGTVQRIGTRAFSGCKKLQTLSVASGVSRVDQFAFEDCVSLKSITIPRTVTNIGARAFVGCSQLQTAYLPVGLASQVESRNVFASCHSSLTVYYTGD